MGKDHWDNLLEPLHERLYFIHKSAQTGDQGAGRETNEEDDPHFELYGLSRKNDGDVAGAVPVPLDADGNRGMPTASVDGKK